MAENKHPAHITVDYFKKGEKPPEPGHPTTFQHHNVGQSDTVPPVQPITPDGQELESGAEIEGQVPTAPPTGQEIVPSISAQAGLIEDEPGEGEVVITGNAALIMAKMLNLPHVWNVNTGEPLEINVAVNHPQLAFIDFEAIRDSAEALDPGVLSELMSAIPMAGTETDRKQAENKRVRDAFVKGPAGPGVTVRQIPGLVHVEVQGPVTLSKSRQGETRVLKIQYHTVEAPTGHAGVRAQNVKVERGHVQNPHQVTHRKMKPIANVTSRTVPRRPPSMTETPSVEPTQIQNEEQFDEQQEF